VCAVIAGEGEYAVVAQASIDERGMATGGRVGDQSGRETNTRPVYTYWAGWDCILRWEGATDDTIGEDMLACIISIKDDHSGYKKGMQVLWTADGGFEYVNHPDSIKLLDQMSEYYSGKPLYRIESSKAAPWVERLAQVTPAPMDATKGSVR
jgi:hypothetical protein